MSQFFAKLVARLVPKETNGQMVYDAFVDKIKISMCEKILASFLDKCSKQILSYSSCPNSCSTHI